MRNTFSPTRRQLCGAGLAGVLTSHVPASLAADAAPPLDAAQSRVLRDWITVLIHAQVEQGPTPRWTHRDCAGLVRFAVAEALRPHDLAWRQAMGLMGQRLPPDLDPQLTAPLRNQWRRADGSQGAFVSALELVQGNTRFIGRQLAQAQAADLLFYDFGDDQHLMVWMGRYIAYHTGRHDAHDNGLRALRPSQLMAWNDTRWRPASDNPNFVGLYRLAFIA
ncbi:DUF1175 family protein [Ideonella azotifigens]|uniref:DUF1175 domain-containing protein n=2 Tax=Ideonella azotifigens TaxID=513160 RepID=A0ABN1KB39_9BURK|nr:DUF1175 family protein [Ideonella azotifigens]MCD2344102.1 DUF1175 family protein [Ideonella azotifigens]